MTTPTKAGRAAKTLAADTHTNPISLRRHRLGLSMQGLSAISGVSLTAVFFAEHGKRCLPRKLILGLSEATGEPYEALLEAWLAWRTGGGQTNSERLESLIRIAPSRLAKDGNQNA